MTLTEFVARVREDLKDTDAQNYLWTDDEIEGAIQRAVDRYTLAAPIQQVDDIATTDGATELDISGLTGILQIESVEYPIGETPKSMQRFNYWAGALNMTDEGDGTDARVKWYKTHTVGVSSTIPTYHDFIIVLGATGWLAMSASAYIVDKATISGRWGTQNYRTWGKERLRQFHEEIAKMDQASRVRTRQLFTDEG